MLTQATRARVWCGDRLGGVFVDELDRAADVFALGRFPRAHEQVLVVVRDHQQQLAENIRLQLCPDQREFGGAAGARELGLQVMHRGEQALSARGG